MLQCPAQKSVVVMRRSDGAFITGDAVRQLLKIPKGGKDSAKRRVTAVDADGMPDFSLFVQSTSHNRVLVPNTRVLYRRQADPVEKTTGDKGTAAAAAGVAGRRGRGNKGGGGVARQMRSAPAAKKSLTEATKCNKTERKHDDREEEAEAGAAAAKKRKTSAPPSESAPPGGQGRAQILG